MIGLWSAELCPPEANRTGKVNAAIEADADITHLRRFTGMESWPG
jgi:hypothetical protein